MQNLAANYDYISYNLFAYCLNNPINMEDNQGNVANAIIGGLVGGLIGGLSSLAQGKEFSTGFAKGAASGAIAGLAVDIALATAATGGAFAIAAGAAIAFAGGMGASIAGEQVESIATTGTGKKVDRAMWGRAAVGGVIILLSFGLTAGINVNAAGKVTGSITKFRDYFNATSDDIISAFTATHFAVQGELAGMLIPEPEVV